MKENTRVFIMGQCTLHWGRMEFGNIGNYYVIEPFFEQIRRVFPKAEIATTFQFSDEFCKKFGIITVPMEAYYEFGSDKNLSIACGELEAVNTNIDIKSIYIEEVKKSSLVIDFSGDIWGENANFLGKDRFITGCYKDLIAQKLRPTVMLAGSPGPFYDHEMLELAQQTYAGFIMVTNREPVSTRLLKEQDFNVSKTYDFACPSFLFRKAAMDKVNSVCDITSKLDDKKLNVGFIICGWNFKRGPFDAWPREDEEYNCFVDVISNIITKHNANVFLMSHSNGFLIPPNEFELIHGRDYPILEQLLRLLKKRGLEDYVTLLDGIYLPDVTKGIISNFDMVISGRLHGAVAALSQGIPTIIIDYGHEPKAHKLRGFAEVMGVEDCVVDPNDEDEFIDMVSRIIEQKDTIGAKLSLNMANVEKSAREQFDKLKGLIID